MAVFKIDATFNIAGRGFVIAGDIIEGNIQKGNKIITDEGSPLNRKRIIALEYIDNIRTRSFKIGLIILYQTEEELEKLKSLKLEGSQIELIE